MLPETYETHRSHYAFERFRILLKASAMRADKVLEFQ